MIYSIYIYYDYDYEDNDYDEIFSRQWVKIGMEVVGVFTIKFN